MLRQYSIAEARQELAAIVHEAEASGPIQFTRRGKKVAVLLAQSDYERLTSQHRDFWAAYEAFCLMPEFANVDVDPEVFNVRDR